MENKLFVGNLPYSVDSASLTHNFSEYGSVVSAKVMTDRETGQSKGFGFVEMGNSDEAQAAIQGLNGMRVDGRAITVNVARPKADNGSAGGGYGGGRRSY